MHVYVWEPQLAFTTEPLNGCKLTTLDRDEVIMVPYKCCCFFGQIRPGADPGRGKNRSLGVPFFNERLLQTGRLQQQTEYIVMIKKHVGCSIVTFCSIPKSNF